MLFMGFIMGVYASYSWDLCYCFMNIVWVIKFIDKLITQTNFLKDIFNLKHIQFTFYDDFRI